MKFLGLAAIVLILLFAEANAYSVNSMKSYIYGFMPSNVVNASKFYNVSISNSTFAIMELSNSSYLIINVSSSSNFSLVNNENTTYSVMSSYFVNKYYPNASVLESLNTLMHNLIDPSLSSISTCRGMLGLSYGGFCTQQNNCAPCMLTYACKNTMEKWGGITGPFGTGATEFYSLSTDLTLNSTAYFSDLASINKQNIASMISVLVSRADNITKIANQLPYNHIFPAPSDYTSIVGNCAPYFSSGNVAGAPWYCVSIGYCPSVTFNMSAAPKINSTLAYLQSLPLSDSYIRSVSSNASMLAASYDAEILAAQKAKAEVHAAFVGAIYPRYNSTITMADVVLSKINDPHLYSSVSNLEKIFESIKSNATNQSDANLSAEINNSIANIKSISSKLVAEYENLSSYNSKIWPVLYYESLNYPYKGIPDKLSYALKEDANITKELSIPINSSQFPLIYSELKNLSNVTYEYKALPSPGFSYSVKQIDARPVATVMSFLGIPIAYRLPLGPAIAGLISFMIGLLVLLLTYLATYARFTFKHKINRTKRVIRNWHILFAALFFVVLIYALLTYFFAIPANSFIPFHVFLSQISQQNRSVIIFSNASLLLNASCLPEFAQGIRNYEILGTGKTSSNLTYTVLPVLVQNSSKSFNDLYSEYMSAGVPVFYVYGGNDNSSAVPVYKGIYGNIAYVPASSLCDLASALNYSKGV
ncbi:MAG: hypothetical protein ACP5RP_00915 [Candidatus Micrarchaeia archaeon]